MCPKNRSVFARFREVCLQELYGISKEEAERQVHELKD
jgi:hypothetical protein